MKIDSITIAGFRGFNEPRTIDFDDRLTLMYAPNSHGKTSISEALEWLIYGDTSKQRNANYKDEYKGSCRNRHFPDDAIPFVSATFSDGDQRVTYTGELGPNDSIIRFVGEGSSRTSVSDWPLAPEISRAPYPFVLQHALKYLLLTSPSDRYKGFAQILGLDDLGEIQADFRSLSTAPDHCIPLEVKKVVDYVAMLEGRVRDGVSLPYLQKELKRKSTSVEALFDAVEREIKARVANEIPREQYLAELLKMRDKEVSKVFSKPIRLADYSDVEKAMNQDDNSFFVTVVDRSFAEEYAGLTVLSGMDAILKQVEFYQLGTGFLTESGCVCPFCGQDLTGDDIDGIRQRHESLADDARRGQALEKQRDRVMETLKVIGRRLDLSRARHIPRGEGLQDLAISLHDLEQILGPQHSAQFDELKQAIADVHEARKSLISCYDAATGVLNRGVESVHTSRENPAIVQELREVLVRLVSNLQLYTGTVTEEAPCVASVDQILQHELDVRAGTGDVSTLIDLLDHRSWVAKKLEVDAIMAGLKDLKATVDDYTASKLMSSIAVDLNSDVMEWYNQIKTTGDPDSHFSGFDLERTAAGRVRPQRISIKATSYDAELASAVSSLSESKLNALGLCVSLATNLRGSSPFQFLVIDDPVQSLDDQHAIQLTGLIRCLAEDHSRQVILLSHDQKWLSALRASCRDLNGLYWTITGYSKAGPYLATECWAKWRERLSTIEAIVSNPEATQVRLQQAEEEVRIVVCDLTALLCLAKAGTRISPHSLNADKVKKHLTKLGIDAKLVGRIVQTFATTDESHHVNSNYTPDRQRIRQYYDCLNELAQLVK